MSDDLDDDLDLGDESFDDFEKKDSTLGDLWRDNPMVKVGIIILAAGAIFGVIMFFGGEEEAVAPSYVAGGSEITAPPGTQEATPSYVEAIQEETEARTEEAQRTGGSVLPTPIDPPVGVLAKPQEETEEEDPLQRWRRLQEERLERELQRSQTLEPEPIVEETGRSEAMQALAERMAAQMEAILNQQKKPQTNYKKITSVTWLEDLQKKEEEELQEEIAAQQEEEEEVIIERVIVPAGEIAYAQLLTEANSDAPAPVLAQIASGPLAGNRILGDFSVNDEVLTLNFNTVVIDGISTDINAIALDPETTLPGLATEVDHRYFQRIVLPMAAAFVEGTAEAISESGATTITVDGGAAVESESDKDTEQEIATGFEEAAAELTDILDEMADDVKVLVRIEAGTPFGLLFLESVTKQENS